MRDEYELRDEREFRADKAHMKREKAKQQLSSVKSNSGRINRNNIQSDRRSTNYENRDPEQCYLDANWRRRRRNRHTVLPS